MKTVMPLPEDEGREFFAPVITQTYNTLALHCRDVRFNPIFQATNVWFDDWTQTT